MERILRQLSVIKCFGNKFKIFLKQNLKIRDPSKETEIIQKNQMKITELTKYNRHGNFPDGVDKEGKMAEDSTHALQERAV